MRAPLLLTFLALSPLARTQTVLGESAEGMIKEAYENFRGSGESFVFDMRGTEANGKSEDLVHAILYFRLLVDPRTGTKSRAQAELDIYHRDTTDERLTMRIVGDGTNLYRYDIDRRELSTTVYGFYGDRPPAGYGGSDAPKLLAQLRAVTPGLSTYVVRLLTEMNPAGIEYASATSIGFPGRSKLAFDVVPPPIRQILNPIEASFVTDPITKRVSIRGDDKAQRWVFCGMDNVNTDRTATFKMYDADGDPDNGEEKWEIQTLNLVLRYPNRLVDLTLTPNVGTAPIWAFSPYTGAQGAQFRPVASGG